MFSRRRWPVSPVWGQVSGLRSKTPRSKRRPAGEGSGSREIVSSGAPQMRQSEGNNTAKRLSPARPPHRETIEGPATVLAWIARVRSPLLLKTASRVPVERAVHGRRISLQYNGDADR